MLAAMMSLPEILMLFALHDSKGTVHPAAFLAIDHGLRGACLCELRLRKVVQTRKNGGVRRHPDKFKPIGRPLLDRVMEALAEADSPGKVEDWLGVLKEKMPNIRAEVTEGLKARGILGETDKGRVLLPGSVTHPMQDHTAETEMLEKIRTGVRDGEQIQPRTGTLISLVGACNLINVLFDKEDRGAARKMADWVSERDAISRAVREAVAKAEGIW
jgi:hypothetical protein